MAIYPPIEPYRQGMLATGDGHEIYWEECGNPGGKPAVVLHGGPGSGCSPWHRRLFDPAAYRIVLFDQRGSGRSRPHASDPAMDFATNTTGHLLADIKLLRTHLGIEQWLVWGGSWGSTLALVYAEANPERVSEIVLAGVTASRHSELDWLCRGGLAPLLPQHWERFLAGGGCAPGDDPVAAYYALIHGPDLAARDRAVLDWCRWETAVITMGQGPELSRRYLDPRFALGFAKTVTHYFHHNAWVEDGQIFRDIGNLAGIPGALVHGRFDVSAPLATAWELAKAWPDADLVTVDNAGHSADEEGIASAIVAATDRFRAPGRGSRA